tara:strand:- start:745 stop:1122 length:378 start_codon:yes stop_codon:yes gene_type:complete
MIFKVLCTFLCVFLLTGKVYAQEDAVTIKETLEVVTAYCGITEKLDEAQKDDTRVFVGIIDQFNILQLLLGENGFWSVTVKNASGTSCMYFIGQSGTPFLLQNKKENKDLQESTGRKVNGVYIYK